MHINLYIQETYKKYKHIYKICRFNVTKKYKQTGFPDDETSLGYPIHVFQDTIGKVSKEYLVNFDYFVRVMENYGFILVPDEQAMVMGLPKGTGLFKDLYNQMMSESRQRTKLDYRNAMYMTGNEQSVSFMNRYFVFRKIREVDADKLLKMSLSKDIEDMEIPVEKPEVDTKKTKKKVKIVKKK